MKNLSALLLGLALATTTAHATVTITLDGGALRTSSGTTVSDGGLILLVASGTDSVFSSTLDGSFSTSVGSFFSADDQVIASFTVSSIASGIQGGYSYSLSSFAYSGNLTAGDSLQLYWFPTLTTSSTTLGVGTSYGQYRTDSTLNNSSSGWFLPSDPNTIALNFFTISGGGTELDSLGNATLTTVPEPATTVAMLGGAAGLFVMYRRKKQKLVA